MGPKLPAVSVSYPSKVRYGVLGFACSLSLITYLDRICMMRVKEPIQNELHLTDTEMGWIFSIFVIGYGLFEVPGGWMGDNWGARRVLTRVVLWWSLFTALTGCVWSFSWELGSLWPLAFNSFVLMVLIRFLFGVGEAAAFPNLTRVVRNWFPFQERAFASGAIWMCARTGGAAAPVVIGVLARWVGWRPAFWILGLFGVTWSLLFYAWFRDHPEEQTHCNDAERALIREGNPLLKGRHASGHSFPPAGRMVRSATLWAICCVSAAVNFGWYFIPTWQPQYYKDVHGIGYNDSEIVTGLPFLFGAVGCLFGGRLSDWLVIRTGSRRWGRSLLGIVGFSLAGLCVMGMGFAAKPWQAIALLCLANLMNDVAIPVVWAVCADVGGRYVGSVAGLMNMVGAVGGMLSPLLIPVVLKVLPPLPNLAAKAAAGLPLMATVSSCWQPGERWRIIFTGLAGAWFIGAVAWFFVNASKPVFEEKGEQ